LKVLAEDVYRELPSLFLALLPIFVLITLLALNVVIFGDSATNGANQFALIIGGAVAAIIGFLRKVSYHFMIEKISDNIKSTAAAILILLMVGALSGSWLISGIIPAMIFYGLQILNPSYFLPATLVICCIVSLATGSSWTTSATVGIALMGIGKTMNIPLEIVAGAVISGAYFGDKLSPLSDTTNLAPAMAGTDLFTHIRYMTITTIPTISITFVLFLVLGLFQAKTGNINNAVTLNAINEVFNVSPFLFLVPVVVIVLILKKTEPLIALLIGTILGAVFAIIFQPSLVAKAAGASVLDFQSGYKGILNSFTVTNTIETSNASLNELFVSKGMSGMLNTIWLIICAMVFGGVMEAVGGLTVISEKLMKIAKGVFGLFASTVASCLVLNITASDQYLAIVIPGKMFASAFKEKGLAPENLSRTLEDAGTVTSVLIPWNTCGAYNAGVLGVDTLSYLPYTFFSILSPITTLFFAAFNIKIKYLINKDNLFLNE
jgi:Na+:H+ antiporter, NhaC family